MINYNCIEAGHTTNCILALTNTNGIIATSTQYGIGDSIRLGINSRYTIIATIAYDNGTSRSCTDHIIARATCYIIAARAHCNRIGCATLDCK